MGKVKLFEMVDIFSHHGYRVSVMITEEGDITEEKIIAEVGDYDIAVAVGGDGTLNRVVSAIIRSGVDIPLGYIPLGSTNDFGYSLGLNSNIGAICERICTKEPKYIDIGQCDNKYFVYVMCTGLFSSVSYMTSQQLKNVLGHNAYIVKGLSTVKDIKKMHYTVELDGETIEEDLIFAGISNTYRLGGFLSFPKEEVALDDGMFELCLVKYPKNIMESVSLTGDLINSNLTPDRFLRRRVKSARIKFPDPQEWSIDGENGGIHNEVDIKVLPKAIRIIY